MLFIGSHFMVGHLSSFIQSHFETSRKNEVHSLFPTITIVAIFSNFLGSNILKKRIMTPRNMLVISSIIGIGGVYSSSFTTDWFTFRIVFPLSFGFTVGFTNMIHLYLAW